MCGVQYYRCATKCRNGDLKCKKPGVTKLAAYVTGAVGPYEKGGYTVQP